MEQHIFYDPQFSIHIYALVSPLKCILLLVQWKNVHFLGISTPELAFPGCLLAYSKYFFTLSMSFWFASFLSHRNIEVVPFDTLMHFPFDNICYPSRSIHQYIHTHTLSLAISLETLKPKRKIRLKEEEKNRPLLLCVCVCVSSYRVSDRKNWLYIESREIAHVRNALGRKLEFNPIKTNIKWPIP